MDIKVGSLVRWIAPTVQGLNHGEVYRVFMVFEDCDMDFFQVTTLSGEMVCNPYVWWHTGAPFEVVSEPKSA